MPQHYVGLDVHSKQSVFVIADAAGTVIAEGEVPTTPAGLVELRDRHALAPDTPVALETGTSAFFVARQLSALGLAPVVVDAHEVRIKAHRPMQKSDRRDARELCEGLRRGIYRVIVYVPSAPVARVRDTLSRRRHFVRVQTAEINAAKRLLRAAGLGQTRCTLHTESSWASLLETLEPSSDLHGYLDQHRAVWRAAGEQLRTLEHLLAEHQRPFAADLQRLQTIPGVGPIVAATAVAVFADVQRFPDAKHAASYAGLTPSTHQSGARDVHGRITKRGSAELRAMLCEAAQHAARPQHPLHPYFAQQCAQHGYKRAVIAVAHRLCRIMFAMLRHGRDFDVTQLGIEVGPFTATSIKPYRLKLVPRRSARRAVATRA
jgi:transposase